MRIEFGRRAWLMAAAAMTPLLATPAAAQDRAQAQSARSQAAPVVSEIVVTANKREQRISEVPLSITAITGEELSTARVQDVQDLATRTPGLSFQRSGSIAGNGNQIILRGLNTGGDGATVASVVDEAPLSFSSSISGGARFATDFQPFDLSRIEVLRGPQGSLYGATAEGGLIKYVTNAPQIGRFGAGIDASVFDLSHGGAGGNVEGYANAPLGDVAALRIGGFYHDSPGWIRNDLAGQRHANSFSRYGGRASLLLKPSDRLSIQLAAHYQKLNQKGFDAVEVNGLANPANPFALLNGYNLNTFLPQPSGNKAQLYVGNVTYDAGPVGLQSITSYGTLDNRLTNDVPLYGQVFGGLLFGRPNTTLFYNVDTRLKKFNQELRLFSNNQAAVEGHGLQYQVGFFYTDERVGIRTDYFTRDTKTGANVTTPLSPTDSNVLQADQTQKYREIAGYADATYFFSHSFDLEVGGRVFNNKQSRAAVQGGAFLGRPLGSADPKQASQETSGTFAVSPRYHFNRDVMIYARLASGYRPGGPESYIAGAPASLPRQYNSDRTVNYEIGVKGLFLDRRLTVDAALFYIDWTRVQVNVAVPVNQGQANGVAYTVVENAGKAVSKGAEWSLTFTPTSGLSLSAIGSYTNARLTQDAPGIGGLNGDRLPYVPKWTYTFAANYERPITDTIRGSVGLSYSHTGDRFSGYALTPSLSHLRFPGYNTVMATLGLRQGNLGLELYGKNLTDARGITYYYAGQAALGGYIPAQVGLIRPREIGVRFTDSF